MTIIIVEREENSMKMINQNTFHSRCVYTAAEVQQMLGIGKNETYRLIHSKVFPSLRIGHRIVIPKETFHRWLNGGS